MLCWFMVELCRGLPFCLWYGVQEEILCPAVATQGAGLEKTTVCSALFHLVCFQA